VAEELLGDAEDGSEEVFFSWHAPSSSGGIHAQHTQDAPHAVIWRHEKDELVKDVAQDVAQDVAFGARAARALLATPPPPRLATR
jgi:hypothetical protein